MAAAAPEDDVPPTPREPHASRTLPAAGAAPHPDDPEAPSEGLTNDTDEDEKRGNLRAAVALRVDYRRLNTFFADYTKNISRGGTFIRTPKPLAIGTEFVFILGLPSREERLELLGQVMWIVEEDVASPDNPAGMGIKFKFQDEGERRAVAHFVERLMDEALGTVLAKKLRASSK